MYGCKSGYQGLNCKKGIVLCYGFENQNKNQCFYNWIKELTFLECNAGYYGKNCTSTCGNCLKNSFCHHITGACFEGCKPGYQEPTCIEGTGWVWSYKLNI